MLKYVIEHYSIKKLFIIILEEYIWSVLKHIPNIEGILLRRLFLRIFAGGTGVNLTIQRSVHIRSCNELTLGDNVFINRGCHIDCFGGLSIGDNVGIGPHTVIITADHGFFTSGTNYRERRFVGRKVEIGENSIIGANCYINPGIKIGKGSIIAAGSSVFCDVPDGVTVGPAAMTSYVSSMRHTLEEFRRVSKPRTHKNI